MKYLPLNGWQNKSMEERPVVPGHQKENYDMLAIKGGSGGEEQKMKCHNKNHLN